MHGARLNPGEREYRSNDVGEAFEGEFADYIYLSCCLIEALFRTPHRFNSESDRCISKSGVSVTLNYLALILM